LSAFFKAAAAEPVAGIAVASPLKVPPPPPFDPLELEEDDCSCELTDVQKEKIIKIITTSLNTDFTAAQQYVKNDYNDGLDDSAFDLLTYASADGSPLKSLNPVIMVSIKTSESQPMG
jgi:hypothetical protein